MLLTVSTLTSQQTFV